MSVRSSPGRLEAGELIDAPGLSADDVGATLRDQAWINCHLGGSAAVMAHALPALRACPSSPLRVLDLACGGADLSRTLAHFARGQGRPIQISALDRSPLVTQYAQAACCDYPEITVVQGDALRPPFADGAFDLVILATFLHHLPPEQVIAVLQTARRLCHGQVVAADLVRAPLGSLAFPLLARLLRLHPVSRHDGAVSLRRSYTPPELADLARQAGLNDFTLHPHRFFRMALVFPA